MPFADPALIVARLPVTSNMVVADFGTGTGEYALLLSRKILPNGKVYAIDVQKDLLIRLKNSVAEKHIGNVEFLWGNIEEVGGTKLADRLVDFVLVSNVLFQTESPYKLALEAKRILKPNGKVAVIDWQESFGNMGPHPDQVIPEKKARDIFTEAGFTCTDSFPVGTHHYGFVCHKG